jgi:hypothetical protein
MWLVSGCGSLKLAYVYGRQPQHDRYSDDETGDPLLFRSSRPSGILPLRMIWSQANPYTAEEKQDQWSEGTKRCEANIVADVTFKNASLRL